MTQYSKRRSHTIGYGTTNRLVKLAGWDTIVQKTGFINDAGHCMVMMTKIASRRVVMVLLNTPSNDRRTTDAITLKYWVETGEMPPATQPKSQRRHR
jgi:D-alanyl-D-alanine endopeptidase (penicillin-binding protein 7)